MPSYSNIKSELEESIRDIEPVISLLDDLKGSKRLATPEESKFLNDFSVQHSPEVIIFMLESKAQKRNAKLAGDQRYNPILLYDDKDIKNFRSFLAGLPLNSQFHFDIIFRPDNVHSTALQLNSDGKEIRIITLDTLKKINQKEVLDIQESLGVSELHSYNQGQIMSSLYGCSIFSIQHLNTMNRFANIDHKLGYMKIGESEITELNPIFLKHIQSLSTAEKIKAAHPGEALFINKKGDKTFESHLEDYSVLIQCSNQFTATETKKRNISILYKTEKYLKEALKTLEALHEQGGEQAVSAVLENRRGMNIIKSIYKAMELSDLKTEIVDGLYNCNQIKLALGYRIDRDSLKSSKCFVTKYMSEKIFGLIEQQCEKLQLLEKHEHAALIFNQLSQLSSREQLDTVLECSIPVKDVIKSRFLVERELADISYQFIKKWFVQAGVEGAEAAFSALSVVNHLRKDIENMRSIISIIKDYDANIMLDNAVLLKSIDQVSLWIKAGGEIKQDHLKEMPAAFTPELVFQYFTNAIDKEDTQAIIKMTKIFPDASEIVVNDIGLNQYAVNNDKAHLLEAIKYRPTAVIEESPGLGMSRCAIGEVESLFTSPKKVGESHRENRDPQAPTKLDFDGEEKGASSRSSSPAVR